MGISWSSLGGFVQILRGQAASSQPVADIDEELWERLGGEDPSDPMVRDTLKGAKGIIEMAVRQLGEMLLAVELREPV